MRDAAGAAVLAGRLSSFLRNRHTRPPLTLAVVGAWGSGKSSVLNLLAEDLQRHDMCTIRFNAWHHQKEEHLFAALLQAVRQQAVPPVTSFAGMAVRWRLFCLRVRRRWMAWAAGLAAVAALLGTISVMHPSDLHGAWQAMRAVAEQPAGKPEQSELWKLVLGGLAAPLIVVASFKEILSAFRDRLKDAGLDPGHLMVAAAGATRWRDLGGQLALRVRFAEALQEVTDALGNRKLTILLDDLDRCDPKSVAEIREAVSVR